MIYIYIYDLNFLNLVEMEDMIFFFVNVLV